MPLTNAVEEEEEEVEEEVVCRVSVRIIYGFYLNDGLSMKLENSYFLLIQMYVTTIIKVRF